MNKQLFITILFVAALGLTLGAQETQEGNRVVDYFTAEAPTKHNDPRRFWEIGGLTSIGMANNTGSIMDLFHKDLVIDLDKINRETPEDGLRLNMDIKNYSFIYFNLDKKNPSGRIGGIGGFLNEEGRFDIHVPKDMITLMTQGNYDNHNAQGTMAVSGAVFAEAGIKAHTTIPVLNRKLRLEVAPAWFMPLAYIPRSTLDFTLITEDQLVVKTAADMAVYMPFDTKTGALTDPGGGDLSVSGEYALFPILDLGAVITHIPLIPARLTHKYGLGLDDWEIVNTSDPLNWLQGSDPLKSVKDKEFDLEAGSGELWVLRPLRFDVYALFRPLHSDLITVKPNIGFTVINPSEENYFNWGLEGQLNVKDTFFVSLGTGLEEGLWRHKLGLTLDLHLVAFNLGVGLRSQDFIHSFQLNGLSLDLGLIVGW